MDEKKGRILDRWDFIFLLGESGGGKGTLVDNIKRTWLKDLKSNSMGDIFREKAKTDPEIRTLTEQGQLISDDIAFEIFKEFALSTDCGLIDGFPRNRKQALSAIKFIKEQEWRILVIDLKCDLETIIERLLSRGRIDDKLDIMYKRNLTHRTLHPVLMEEIKTRSDLFDIITVDGNNEEQHVYTEFLLDVLRHVDMLHLYDLKSFSMDFNVSQNETTVDYAINRCVSSLLCSIQEEILHKS